MALTDTAVSRRKALIGAGTLGAATFVPASARGHTTSAGQLDLANPAHRLRAMIRLRGAEEFPFWMLIEGDVYGRDPASTMTPLFKFTALLRLRYTRLDDNTYEFQQRESSHYTNLETGEPIGEFHNPYKDETNVAVGYVSPLFTYRFGLNGTSSPSRPDHMGDLPHQLTQLGGYLQTTERRFLSYPTRLDLEMFPEAARSTTRHSVDIATFRAPFEMVTDLSRDLVSSAIDFVADTEWPFWMFMGERPGNAWWLGHGAKLRERGDLPADVVRRVEQVHPGFLDDPWGLDATPYKTDYQMEQLRKAGII